jgi:hypothetical protein
MPRRVRARLTRPSSEPLNPGAVAALIEELPFWLADFLLYRTYPPRGTADAQLLGLLMADPVTAPYSGMLCRSKMAAVWKAHRIELLARWAAEGRKGEPFAARMDVVPFDPDPRAALTSARETAWTKTRGMGA